jgi:PPOX class probable F420-dependent enzyme
MSDELTARIGDEKFVALTTFKKDGTPVATPMWIARDGAHLVVWTPAEAWKVKRARRDPRVEMTPCSRTGKVAPGAPVLHGTAEVVTDTAAVDRAEALIKAKYGLQFRIITALEALLSRGRKPRVALQISPTAG